MRWSLVSVPSWDEGVVLYSPYINQSLGRGYSRKGVRPWVRWPPHKLRLSLKMTASKGSNKVFISEAGSDWHIAGFTTYFMRDLKRALPSWSQSTHRITRGDHIIPSNLGFGNEFVKHSGIGRRESGTRTSLLKGQREEEEPVETQRRSYSERRR